MCLLLRSYRAICLLPLLNILFASSTLSLNFPSYETVLPLTNTRIIAVTKNGLIKLAAPPALDLEQFKTDKKIDDEEILKILEQPLGRATGGKSKNKKKKKKPAKKAGAEEEEESSDEE
jgi:hypothetical protein